MTEFWFIRHGESESNAGLASKSDQDTPLTRRGLLQAQHIADHLSGAPDLFVISPYLRAIQTAEKTLSKFPDTPQETWLIQEFSYLSHELYHNTTSNQRGALSRTFFKRADPDLVLGDGGESFNQFIQRIVSCLAQLSRSDKELIILFGHGWFMRATLWHLLTTHYKADKRKTFMNKIQNTLPSLPLILKIFSFSEKLKVKKMFSFLLFSAGVQIPNGGIMKLKFSSQEFDLIGFELDHMPENLIETTWRNR